MTRHRLSKENRFGIKLKSLKESNKSKNENVKDQLVFWSTEIRKKGAATRNEKKKERKIHVE